MKRYIVNLTPEERAGLEQLCSRGKTSALMVQRAQILIRADDGLTDEEIVQELQVGRATVERVRQRCVVEGLQRALERELVRDEFVMRQTGLGVGGAHAPTAQAT